MDVAFKEMKDLCVLAAQSLGFLFITLAAKLLEMTSAI